MRCSEELNLFSRRNEVQSMSEGWSQTMQSLKTVFTNAACNKTRRGMPRSIRRACHHQSHKENKMQHWVLCHLWRIKEKKNSRYLMLMMAAQQLKKVNSKLMTSLKTTRAKHLCLNQGCELNDKALRKKSIRISRRMVSVNWLHREVLKSKSKH